MNRDKFTTLYSRLNATRTRYTECIKITRTDGTVYRFTALDEVLRVQEDDGGFYNYLPADSFKLTALENQSGLVVSNMDVDAIVSDASIAEADLIGGRFDNANVELFIVYWSGPQMGRLPLRTSWIGEVNIRGASFKADLRGIAQKLQQIFIQTTSLECRWTFCDAKCGLNAATYTRRVTVTVTESNDTFDANIAAPDRGKFQWGLAKWVTGANAGLDMEIIRNYQTRLQLFLPMPFNVEVGDTLDIIYGCDKVFQTCNTVYGNADRFGGEPFLAGSDLLVTYPKMVDDEDEDSGGKF